MQIKGAMRLAAVQEDGDGCNRDVGQEQLGDDRLPPGQVQQSAIKKIKQVHGVPWKARPDGAGARLTSSQAENVD
jgi:hypothetical protein